MKRTRIDIITTNAGVEVYARREDEAPVFIDGSMCGAVADLHGIAPGDTAALHEFVNSIEDVSGWEPFSLHGFGGYIDIITGRENGIDAPRSIYHETIAI